MEIKIQMKNLLSKLIPLITKLQGKKPLVIIFSILMIGLSIYAVQKGYITEDSIDFGSIIDQIDQTLSDTSEVSDTIEIKKIDTVFITVDSIENNSIK